LLPHRRRSDWRVLKERATNHSRAVLYVPIGCAGANSVLPIYHPSTTGSRSMYFAGPTSYKIAIAVALAVLPSLLGCGDSTVAEPGVAKAEPREKRRRVLTRIFFQDDDARTVKWADVLDGPTPQLGTV